jgi:S-formylglutathione hydrolase FrmB
MSLLVVQPMLLVSALVMSAVAAAVIPACFPAFRRARRRALGLSLTLAIALCALFLAAFSTGSFSESSAASRHPLASGGTAAQVQRSGRDFPVVGPRIRHPALVRPLMAAGPRAGGSRTGRHGPEPMATHPPAAAPALAVAGPRIPPNAKPVHHRGEPAQRPDFVVPTVAETSPDGSSWQVPTRWSDPATWPDRGTIVTTTLYGTASGLAERAYIYLPPVYFGLAPARNLPITIVFSGYPGTAQELIARGRYPDALLTGLATNQVAPMVLVMLPPAVTFPWDTECTDIPNGPQAFTYYSHDLPDAVADQFHLNPTGYASIGDSTGGYCAAKLESLDPSRFTVAVALSGYFHPAADSTTHGEFNDTTLRDRNDLGWRLQHLPAPPVALLLATAYDERGDDGYNTSADWLALIKAPMVGRELVLEHGKHNFATWDQEIPYGLSWISTHLAGTAVDQAPTPPDAVVTNSAEPGDNDPTDLTPTGPPPTVAPDRRDHAR